MKGKEIPALMGFGVSWHKSIFWYTVGLDILLFTLTGSLCSVQCLCRLKLHEFLEKALWKINLFYFFLLQDISNEFIKTLAWHFLYLNAAIVSIDIYVSSL